MSVVKPQSFPSPVVSTAVNPLLSRINNPAYRVLPPFWFDESDNPEGENKNKKSVAEIVKEAVNEIVTAANGNKDGALETLVKRNHRLEQRAEKAEGDLLRLKEQLPDEDEQKKQADELEKWRALGESPDAVKGLIDSGNAAIEKAQTLEREKVVSEAAQATGFKPDVLNDLAQSKGFTVDVREVEVVGKDGKKATEKQAWAKFKDGDKDTDLPLLDFVEQRLKAYEPSLKAESAAPQLAPMVAQASGKQEKVIDQDAARAAQGGLYRTF